MDGKTGQLLKKTMGSDQKVFVPVTESVPVLEIDTANRNRRIPIKNWLLHAFVVGKIRYRCTITQAPAIDTTISIGRIPLLQCRI